MNVLNLVSGGKTIGIAIVIIVYVGYSMTQGTEADPNVVNGLLAGGLITLRAGIKKNGTPSA